MRLSNVLVYTCRKREGQTATFVSKECRGFKVRYLINLSQLSVSMIANPIIGAADKTSNWRLYQFSVPLPHRTYIVQMIHAQLYHLSLTLKTRLTFDSCTDSQCLVLTTMPNPPPPHLIDKWLRSHVQVR